MGMRSRLSWMVSGPARIEELERSVQALQRQLDQIQAAQDERLDEVRVSVRTVLDDVSARLAALDGADAHR